MAHADRGGFLRDQPETGDGLGPLVVTGTSPGGNRHDTGNEPPNPLGANQTFTGQWVDVSGEGSILWIVAGLQTFSSVTVQWSDDGSTVVSSQVLADQPTTAGGFTYHVYLFVTNNITAGKYFRVVIVNGPTQQTGQVGFSGIGEYPYEPLIGVEDTLSLISVALLTRSVIAGKDPSGNFVNQRVVGTYTFNPAPPASLNAGVAYTSEWIDCEGYPAFKLLIAADQASADNGIKFEWSDTSGGTVRTQEFYTFRTGNINDGLLIITQTRARWLRITYTNGTTNQGRFFINLRLNPVPLVNEINLISMRRAQTSQVTLTTGAQRIDPGAISGRRSVRIKNLSSSARAAFYGFTNGVTGANGDELAPGEAVDLDLDEFVNIYALCTSTGGAGVTVALTEIA